MRRVLVSIVGNPLQWKTVKYSIRDLDGNEQHVVSSVSCHAISEVVGPDMSIVIGLDTLADLPKGSYSEVIDSSRAKIIDKLKEVGWDNFHLEISPGVGKFQNGVFGGDPLDFYFFTFMRLFEKLKDEQDIELHLDITHGINYTMNMTYRAVVDILSSISLRGGKVRLIVYNSEPVSLGPDYDPDGNPKAVNIHKIEKRIIQPDFRIGKIEGDIIRSGSKSPVAINRKIINSMISCFENMLIMPYRYILEHNDVDLIKISKSAMDIYLSSIVIDNNVVKKGVVFTRDVYPFMKALAYDYIFRGFGISYPVDVKEIKDIVKSLSKSNKFGRIVASEMSDIIKLSDCIPENQWTLLAKIKKGCDFDPSKMLLPINERNFLAHGGLEMNNTEIMRRGDSVFAKYSDDAHGRIMDVISRL